MWNLGILNSFTLEATFNGSTLSKKSSGWHFSPKDYEQLAVQFCDSLLDYCDPDQTKVIYFLTFKFSNYQKSIKCLKKKLKLISFLFCCCC